MPSGRTLRVACALMEKRGRLFAAKRNPGGRHGGLWELPGGKIEPGETPEKCIQRELWEELGIHVDPIESWPPVQTVLPGLAIRLFPVVCLWKEGEIKPREHEEWGWFSPKKLPALDWSPADRPVLRQWLNRKKPRAFS